MQTHFNYFFTRTVPVQGTVHVHVTEILLIHASTMSLKVKEQYKESVKQKAQFFNYIKCIFIVVSLQFSRLSLHLFTCKASLLY